MVVIKNLRRVCRWAAWGILGLLIPYFALLSFSETSAMKYTYASLCLSCAVLFLAAVVYPNADYLRMALKTRKVLDQSRSVTQIYGSPEFLVMADSYWRKRLNTLPRSQYVYVIRDCSVTDFYKIGKTNNPYKRLSRFEVMLPFNIQIVSIMPCVDMHRLEAVLHWMLREKRVRGEWFWLNAADLEKIISLETQLLFVETPSMQRHGNTNI